LPASAKAARYGVNNSAMYKAYANCRSWNGRTRGKAPADQIRGHRASELFAGGVAHGMGTLEGTDGHRNS